MTRARAEAWSACVSAISAKVAAASPAVMPGTISSGMPAVRRACGLFAQVAEDARIAGFQPDHRLPCRAASIIERWISSRGTSRPLQWCPRQIELGPGANVPEHAGIDEVVVEHDVGQAQAFGGPQGERARIARSAPTR